MLKRKASTDDLRPAKRQQRVTDYCFTCAKYLKTRNKARVSEHKKKCIAKYTPTRSRSISPPSTRRQLERSRSVDQSLSILTPAVLEWENCPICNCRVLFPKRRQSHLDAHFRNKQLNYPTPAQLLAVGNAASPSQDAEFESPARQYYSLSRPVSRIDNVRLNSVEERLSFKLSDKGIAMAKQGHLISVMDIIIRDVIQKHQGNPHALLRLIFDSDSLDYAFSGLFQNAGDYDVYNFLENLERVINSKQSVQTDENLQLYVQSIAVPLSGSGKKLLKRKDYTYTNARTFLKAKYSIFFIQNEDQKCFFLAVAAGLKFREAAPNMKYKAWFRTPHSCPVLKDIADHLILAVQHPSDQPVTPAIFPRMQEILSKEHHVQLIIFNSDDNDMIYFFGEPSRNETDRLYLTYADNHFSYIKNKRAYLGVIEICELCLQTFRTKHRCRLKCDRCRSKECFQARLQHNQLTDLMASVECEQCTNTFYSEFCLLEHKTLNKCEKFSTCPKCDQRVSERDQHICGKINCSNCKRWVFTPHFCHTVVPVIKNKEKFTFIAFDIETLVNKSGIHVAYLLCSMRVCEMCCDLNIGHDEPECSQCIKRSCTFYGLNCMSSFCEYLLHPCNKGAVLLSHNGSAFDNYFVIDEIMKNGEQPKVLTRGHRFLRVDLGRSVTMLDTCQFFFCKLVALSQIFEIPEEKGYFPFKFASVENLYKTFQKYPSAEMYGYSQMNDKSKIKFMEWYESVKLQPFCFREEATRYCIMDTLLLCKASMRFRKLVKSEYGIDPWLNAVSLSHLASVIYRKWFNFTKTETLTLAYFNFTSFLPNADPLGIIPTTGYTDMYRKQASLLGIKYLEWIKKETGLDILHGGNRLEERVLGRFPCDGIVLKNRELPVTPDNVAQVYDIRGCFYHCHRNNCTINCRLSGPGQSYQKGNLDKPHPLAKDKSYRDIIDNDNRRIEWFSSQGIKVQTIYECEINAMVKQNLILQKFFLNDKIWSNYALPIGPREALFGGRVTVGRLLCELTSNDLQDGYEILYDDFISLYPAVMRSEKYPIGHPDIIKYPRLPETLTENNIDSYFGLVKAKVLPAQDLLYGVLPFRQNGKLLFSLCQACSKDFFTRELSDSDFDESGNVECCHCDDDRAFWGVFCTVELKLALQMGYKVLLISEIWPYAKGDLFSGYVNGMIAMKVENSGYPENYVTNEAKKAYVEEMARDNIVLNPENIRKCNGKRQIGKLLANSLWGKISQGIDRTNTVFVSKPHQLSELLKNPSIEITDCMFMRQGACLCVSYKESTDIQRKMGLYNPTVGSFVTAYGRIRLYSLMFQTGSNFIYGDTDSVIYLTAPGLFVSTHGTNVGDVASEIDWPNDCITKFVCGGPKTYSYVTRQGVTSMKAKGLSLKSAIGEKIDFDHVKAIVLKECPEVHPKFYDLLDEPLSSKLKSMHTEKQQDKEDPNSFLLLPQSRIVKDKRTLELRNKDIVKVLQFSGADKRRILRHPSLKTVEFGYKSTF